ILFVPGGPFYPITGYRLTEDGNDIIPSVPEEDTMRLGFSYATREVIAEGIERLGKFLTKELG
ncbi:MAG: hypothetical protein ACTSU3_04120, partial [Candidatus Thorarchaeota archaeon]